MLYGRPPSMRGAAAAMMVVLVVGAPLAAQADAELLDGRWYGGRMGVHGRTEARTQDIIEFNDGRFVSRCCLRFGFAPAPYEATQVGDAVHFKAVTESPTHGTMIWQGTIEDGVATVRLDWRRELALWTHRNRFWFEGEHGNVVQCDTD